jgi:hypothetical protein
MAATYEPIQTYTASGSSAEINFTSIPSTYTDLVLIIGSVATTSGAPNICFQYNGDTASNYSATYIEGNGSSAGSTRRSNQSLFTEAMNISLGGSTLSNVILNIQNYSNATTYKTTLIRTNEPSTTYAGVGAAVVLWRKTPEAINAIKIYLLSGNFASSSTFTLYGIKAA